MPRASRSLSVVVGLMLALALHACTNDDATPDTGEVGTVGAAETAPAELTAASEGLVAAWNQEDAAAVAEFYATDAVVTADSTFEGRDAIRDRWIAPALPIGSNLVTTDRNFSGSGDTMTEWGRFSYTATLPDSAPAMVSGTYESTWERDGGEWKVTNSVIKAE